MNTRSVIACILAPCVATTLHCATPLTDVQMGGLNNQVKGNATLTILSGGNLTIATGGTFSAPANAVAWAAVNKSGSSLADLVTRSASDLTSGTLPDARFPATLPAVDGSLLTNLNASQLASGTIPDARFPATLPTADGSLLTNLNGSQVNSGTIPAAQLPLATSTTFGAVKPDGTTITISGGVITGAPQGAPTNATYITETSDATLTNEFALGSLSTGLLKNTTTTGVPSIATAGTDYVAPGALTSSGLTMSTARLIGRSTAGTGAPEEITIGSGLTLSGGTLTGTGGFASPMTSVGDMIVGSTGGAAARLAVGTAGQVLTVASGTPTWTTAGGATYQEDSFTIGSPVTLTTDTEAQIGTLTLSAGDWYIGGDLQFQFDSGTTVFKYGEVGINTSAGLAATTHSQMINFGTSGVIPNTDERLVAPIRHVSLGSSTTYYLWARAGFSASFCKAQCTMWALQIPSIIGQSGTLTLARYTAIDAQPPASAYATLDTRNSIAVLNFDDTSAESTVFVGVIPQGADFTTGIRVTLHWMGATATSGNVIWTTAFERCNTDLDADSFDTGVDSSAAAANATSGIITSTSIDHSGSQIDGLTAGDLFRLKITRKAADASDTMTGDAQLIAVEIRQR